MVAGPELVSVKTKEQPTVPVKLLTSFLGLLLFVAVFTSGGIVGRVTAPDPAPQIADLQVQMIKDGCIPTAFVTGVGAEQELSELTKLTDTTVTSIKLQYPDAKRVIGRVVAVPDGSPVEGVWLGIITLERCLDESK